MSSPALARALVESLLEAGVTDAVCAPGSRSAPLLLSLAAAERAGQVRLHVRVDERSAGYLALGLARGSGRPVPVITTSGTAAVNLHPAVVEASYLGVPLLALTADRPSSAIGSGANQTIDQRELYGVDVRAYIGLENADPLAATEAVREALAVATARGNPGPVHLNVHLAEPLVDDSLARALPVPTPLGAAPVQEVRPVRPSLRDLVPTESATGLVIVGDHADPILAAEVAHVADETGWPVISEPTGNASALPNALWHGPLLLEAPTFADAHVPDVVLTVGRVGLHRSVMSVLRRTPVHLAVRHARGLHDPVRTASLVIDAVPEPRGVRAPAEWTQEWLSADGRARAAVEEQVQASGFTGIAVARQVCHSAGADEQLVIGPSYPVRHVSAYAGPVAAHCWGNRGTSGIDGVISTAWGIACSRGQTLALVGDLTALYDRNGLLAAPGEPLPDLAIVVVDNNGGGIFSSLEQGAPGFAGDFDRVFGTPHHADLRTLLAAPGVEVSDVSEAQALDRSLEAARASGGVHVLIARTSSREAETRALHAIQAAVAAVV